MDNQEANNNSSSSSMPPADPQSNSTNGSNASDEEIITQITLAGLRVIMLRKGDQIIYKLPDEVVLSSIGDAQRAQLLSEIKALHAATLAAAARNTTPVIKSEANTTTKTIAPKQPIVPPQLLVPQVVSEHQDVETDAAMRETARKLLEEYEQQQQQQQQRQQSPVHQGEIKTTRKYVKTGKYSKKRLYQHHQSVTPPPQQQQAATPAIVAPQQAVASGTPLQEQHLQQHQQPINLSSQLVSNSILAKRLPEEEGHHQEIKRRIFDSIVADHRAVLDPDYETPFKSAEDAINRLLPYHIFQYPKADLEANKIPLDRLDLSTVELIKAQAEMFQKFSTALGRPKKDDKEKHIQIMLERQMLADQRQKLTEEQARVAAEQAAQQQAELIRMQEEQARAAAEAAAAAEQQHQDGSAMAMMPPAAAAAANYVNNFPQASALLQNPEFAQQYNQLPPEIRKQFFMHNPQQLAAMLAEQTTMSHNASAPPHQ